MFIKLQRLSDYERVTINVAEIVKVRTAERGTSIVYLRSHDSEHVVESHDQVHELIEKANGQSEAEAGS